MPGNLVIDPDAAFVNGVAHRFSLSLATLVVDQTLLSESDLPFEPFTADFAVDRRLSAERVPRRRRVRFDATGRPGPGVDVLRSGRGGRPGERRRAR